MVGMAPRMWYASTFKILPKQQITLAVSMRLGWGGLGRCSMLSLMEKRSLSNVHIYHPSKQVQVFAMRSCFWVGFTIETSCDFLDFVKIKESRSIYVFLCSLTSWQFLLVLSSQFDMHLHIKKKRETLKLMSFPICRSLYMNIWKTGTCTAISSVKVIIFPTISVNEVTKSKHNIPLNLTSYNDYIYPYRNSKYLICPYKWSNKFRNNFGTNGFRNIVLGYLVY